MNVTACRFNRYCQRDLFHRNGDACVRVDSEVRNAGEIKEYPLSAWSVSGIRTASEVPMVGPGGTTRNTRDGMKEAVGSRLQRPLMQ